MTGSTFYVVWNPLHGLPRVRHDTPEAAYSEARRLARENPGAEFIVLVATKIFRVRDPVEEVTLDEIPF